MPLAQLVDAYGRTARKLRISVTDRCNLRCLYCLPEEPAWLPRAEILSFEEIERVARVLVGLGVEKVRLTGGEPLVRTDVQKLAARLALIPGLKGLTMTTNGLHLDEKARPLNSKTCNFRLSVDIGPAAQKQLPIVGEASYTYVVKDYKKDVMFAFVSENK